MNILRDLILVCDLILVRNGAGLESFLPDYNFCWFVSPLDRPDLADSRIFYSKTRMLLRLR